MVFQKAIVKAEPDGTLKQRVSNLIDSITSSVFQYTTRGLFECDKLTYTAQLAFQVGAESGFHLLHGLFSSTSSPLNRLLRRPTASFGSNQAERKCAGSTKSQSPSRLLCPSDPADE